jgi:two-component system chemotaxis sensor kinase CheA
MNEFVEQFLLESRELIEQATADLIALEQGAGGRDKLDGLFRAFHTLKGAAGIVEFAAMGRALHAAEEVLSEVRSTARPVAPKVVNDCLACLDQITRWLDEMQVNGSAPVDADRAADQIVRSFARSPAAPASDEKASAESASDWLEQLRDSHREKVPDSGTALCYRPDADAFFRGEDPLALVATIPGLVAVDLAWQKDIVLADMDPFACVIRIVALTKAPADQVRSLLGGVIDQVEIVELVPATRDPVRRQGHAPIRESTALPGDLGDDAPITAMSSRARALLDAQVLLLEVSESEGKIGRLAAAGRVCVNVLRHAGLAADASDVEAALAESLTNGDASRLVSAVENVLAGKTSNAPVGDGHDVRVPQAAATRAMRVDMERIDSLVNLTGELTTVKNAFGHLTGLAHGGEDPQRLAAGLREQQLRLGRLVGELQRAVLRIRILPLRRVFQRFPRLVREIAARLSKPVRFVTEGDATEADAAIVESLFEPLLHVLRNAVDHGIEASSRRAGRGKPSTATIVLRARRHLDNVIVEVEDDGGGIDVGRVREAAVARNLVSSEVLSDMADADVINLIFLPGFSTASEVTGLSGRGVGMDSVKSAVERVGGHVNVESRPGQGTIVRLSLPFTVMMTRVMTVETAGQVFGFPLDTVIETAMVARDHIVAVGAGRAFALRDKTVPLIDLAESLGLSRSDPAGEAKVVVTSAAGQVGGIEVEKLGERMDVMLKPMDGLLSGMRGVAGTTLLGDGRVLIVLDIQELFQ